MSGTYHQERRESPNRRDFEPARHRRWHTMTTLVEYAGAKVPGRLIIPLRLVRPEEFPGIDMAAASYLVGRSWAGGLLQVPVWTWIKGAGPLAMSDGDGHPPVRERPYPNLFLLVKVWKQVGHADANHPVLGPMTVKVMPRMVETDKGRLFEGEVG